MSDFKVGDLVVDQFNGYFFEYRNEDTRTLRHATREEKFRYYKKQADKALEKVKELGKAEYCELTMDCLGGPCYETTVSRKQYDKIKLMLDIEDFVKRERPDWHPEQDCRHSTYMVFKISVPTTLAEKIGEVFRYRIESSCT